LSAETIHLRFQVTYPIQKRDDQSYAVRLKIEARSQSGCRADGREALPWEYPLW